MLKRALHDYKMKIVLFIFISVLFFNADALQCYTCSMSGDDTDQKCLTDPEKAHGTSITDCNKKYCIIIRQENKDPRGKIQTFLRGCEDNPLFLNEEQEDWNYITYYRSCTSDLCNNGDGIRSSDGGVNPDGLAGENLLIPGLGRNIGQSLHIPFTMFIIVLVFLIL